MNTTTIEAKSPKQAVKTVANLDKTKELLLRTSNILGKILNSEWLWIEQARAISTMAYMHDNNENLEGIKNFPEMMEKMSELLFVSIKNDAASGEALNLMTELQKAAESLSGLPQGS